MSAPIFTILVPTHNHSQLIPFTIQSIQAQTLADFELFIVGDGAPPATRDAVAALAKDDPRIRYFENPKGQGHGERYRHEALKEASGSLVCYCGDADLWLPNHLEVLARGLQTADFVHTLQTEIHAEGHVFFHPSDLSRVGQRDRMMREMFNTFGPTVAGHTMAAYRGLPHGWRPRPSGMWSDLHMWRQFFDAEGLVFATIPRVTSIKFAQETRRDWTAQRRFEEVKDWWQRSHQNGFAAWFEHEGLRSISQPAERSTPADKIKPADIDSAIKEAVADHQAGRLPQAEAIYRQVLATDPDHSVALHLLGLIAYQAGNAAVAEPYMTRAVAINPDYADAHSNLGAVYRTLGRHDEAIASCVKALALAPKHSLAHNNLGNALWQSGRLDEASSSFHEALALDPDFALAHNNLGNVRAAQGRREEAVASYRRALEIDPDYADAHNNLGNELGALKQFEAAATSYRRAIEINPDHADAHNNLGTVLKDLGRLDEATACFHKTLSLAPAHAMAHCNLGTVLAAKGHWEDAVSYHRKALELAPNFTEAHNNLGNALRDLGRLREAAESLRRAIELDPNIAAVHNNLGNVFKDLGQLDDAAASFRKAVALDPGYGDARSNLIFTLKCMAQTTSAELLAEAQMFGRQVASMATPFAAWKASRDPEKRLRVGLVSGDFRDHVIGRFLASFLPHVDDTRVEFIAYSNTFMEDEMSTRLKSHFSLWRNVMGLSDHLLADLIHDDGIDILIDLSNHTAFNRLPMFAYRPAPVQATWLGLFVSSGVPGIDYIISDPYLLPPEEEQYVTEVSWPLAESWLCLSRPEINIEPGPLPALSIGIVTFGCFNNLAKMTGVVVALWAKVLDAVPGSRLFLKTPQLLDPVSRRATLDRFAVHGIGPQRLILEGGSPFADYFAAYNRVDIALDPFPFHGATISLDGLWMGVPLLTLRGDRMDAHLGEGICHNAGLQDWIAEDAEDYIAKAVSMSADLEGLARLRAALRDRVLASPLYDGPRFARHFEDALHGMWRKACGD